MPGSLHGAHGRYRRGRYLPVVLLAIALAALWARDSRAQPAEVSVIDPTPLPAATPAPQLTPRRHIRAWAVDELKGDHSFNRLRRYLRDAIRRRDSGALRGVLSHDFVAGYCCEGAPRGQEAIDQWWSSVEHPSPGYYRNFWRILDDALKFGVKNDSGHGGLYCGPAFDSDGAFDEDPYVTIVIANDVPLRKEPRESSPVVAHVSWEVVRVPDGFGVAGRFVLVSNGDGRSGYVDSRRLRQLDIDPQVCFAKEPDGEWVIRLYYDGGD